MKHRPEAVEVDNDPDGEADYYHKRGSKGNKIRLCEQTQPGPVPPNYQHGEADKPKRERYRARPHDRDGELPNGVHMAELALDEEGNLLAVLDNGRLQIVLTPYRVKHHPRKHALGVLRRDAVIFLHKGKVVQILLIKPARFVEYHVQRGDGKAEYEEDRGDNDADFLSGFHGFQKFPSTSLLCALIALSRYSSALKSL